MQITARKSNINKTQRLFWRLLSVSLLCSIFSSSTTPLAQAATPPNVIVFLADDAGWGDYSQSGNKQLSTPNIDSLAKQGVSLDRFFVCPVCSPTRAEFLTGRYHPRGGVRGVSTGFERLDLDEKTLTDCFQEAGYATGAFGKWHNGSQYPYHPMGRGFDEYFGHTSGHWGEYFNAPLEENGKMVSTEGYIVDVCTDRAIRFIEKNQQRPFFCYVPFTTPHSPWAAPEEDWERFKDMPITQHATLREKEVADHTRCAYAMLENQDRNVGRVLKKLEELNLAENTIIVYFSDNGPNSYRWTGGMKGRKGSTDEGGIRSVCYLRWPAGLPAGYTVKEISGAIDLLPTLLSLTNITRVGDLPLDGKDLTPLLLQQKKQWPDRMLFTLWSGRSSVRTQRYRLDQKDQLYDIVADPGQTMPVNKQHPEIASKLIAAKKDWHQEMQTELAKSSSAHSKADPSNKRRVDPRPLPVGYREFPTTMLPARDGDPHGEIKRSSSAPNCSYFVNWTSTAGHMQWLIDVQTSGKYEVTIDRTCPETSIGAEIELRCQESQLRHKISTAWDPPLNTNQDTLPRPSAESQMKEFRSINLGVLELQQGQAVLSLHALQVPEKSVMDVRRVTLTLVE